MFSMFAVDLLMLMVGKVLIGDWWQAEAAASEESMASQRACRPPHQCRHSAAHSRHPFESKSHGHPADLCLPLQSIVLLSSDFSRVYASSVDPPYLPGECENMRAYTEILTKGQRSTVSGDSVRVM